MFLHLNYFEVIICKSRIFFYAAKIRMFLLGKYRCELAIIFGMKPYTYNIVVYCISKSQRFNWNGGLVLQKSYIKACSDIVYLIYINK